VFHIVTELLALPRCTGCGAPGPEWCDACALVLPDVQWHRIDDDLLLCSAFAFTGPIRQTIVDWKERQHRAARERVERWLEPVAHQQEDPRAWRAYRCRLRRLASQGGWTSRPHTR